MKFFQGRWLAHDPQMQVFPSGRTSRPVGPGVEMREDPSIRRRHKKELDEMASLE